MIHLPSVEAADFSDVCGREMVLSDTEKSEIYMSFLTGKCSVSDINGDIAGFPTQSFLTKSKQLNHMLSYHLQLCFYLTYQLAFINSDQISLVFKLEKV